MFGGGISCSFGNASSSSSYTSNNIPVVPAAPVVNGPKQQNNNKKGITKQEIQQQRTFVEGTAFIRRLTTQLKRQYAAKLIDYHDCFAAHLLHTFVKHHSNAGFNIEDVATTCLWLVLKLEMTLNQCVCTIEVLSSVWFRIKCNSHNSGPPPELFEVFNQYFTNLEQMVLLTNGFRFSIELPHKLVLLALPSLTGQDFDQLIQTSYWLCSDWYCIQLTIFGCELAPSLVAASCTYLAAFWINDKLWQLPNQICRAYERTANQEGKMEINKKETTKKAQITIKIDEAIHYASLLAQSLWAASGESILLKKMPGKPVNYGHNPITTHYKQLPASSFNCSGGSSTTSGGNNGRSWNSSY